MEASLTYGARLPVLALDMTNLEVAGALPVCLALVRRHGGEGSGLAASARIQQILSCVVEDVAGPVDQTLAALARGAGGGPLTAEQVAAAGGKLDRLASRCSRPGEAHLVGNEPTAADVAVAAAADALVELLQALRATSWRPGPAVAAAQGAVAELAGVRRLAADEAEATRRAAARTALVEALACATAGGSPGLASVKVAVTGGGGFIGSWCVKLLLAKGYTVHATLRNTEDPVKRAGLMALPGASERLRLFQADLLKEGAFADAIAGCECVMHTASPFFLEGITDPEEQMRKPAVQGTTNVLRSALAEPSVRRVVLTSSTASIYVDQRPQDHIYTEDDWSDLEHVRKNKLWYVESKLMAEQAAWSFFEKHVPDERELDLVTICPTMVLGPLLWKPNAINTSNNSVLSCLDGSKKVLPNATKCFVDVREVAQAHVNALHPDASGRYMMISDVIPWSRILDVLAEHLPAWAHAGLPQEVAGGPPPPPQALWSRRRAFELGIRHRPIEHSLRDTLQTLLDHGFLAPPEAGPTVAAAASGAGHA